VTYIDQDTRAVIGGGDTYLRFTALVDYDDHTCAGYFIDLWAPISWDIDVCALVGVELEVAITVSELPPVDGDTPRSVTSSVVGAAEIDDGFPTYCE
jgi:hypothetical protein